MSRVGISRPAALVARTRALEATADPLAHLGAGGFAWLRERCGFTTAGVAAVVPAAQVDAALATIEVDDEVHEPGTGAIAVGALPFDRTQGGTLVIPARVFGRTPAGVAWMTEIAPTAVEHEATEPLPAMFRLVPESEPLDWRRGVERVLREIEAGRVAKVVLARAVTLLGDYRFSRPVVLERLRAQQAGCFVFAAGNFLGASPELLVARRGHEVRCQPMAGTAPHSDAASLARLVASAKDGEEHRLVVDEMVRVLTPVCDGAPAARGPWVTRVGDLAHLTTTIEGHLRYGMDTPPSALALARRLHPTPAVAGTPTGRALALIEAIENVPRGRYAGPVGWVDRAGDGEWAIALRSAALDGRRATLHAGAGIVGGSDPAAEWHETEAKLLPTLRALTGPGFL